MAKKTKVQKDVEKYRKQSMTKKALKEYYKKDRGASFKGSTQTFKSAKDYDRKAEKRKTREALRGAEA